MEMRYLAAVGGMAGGLGTSPPVTYAEGLGGNFGIITRPFQPCFYGQYGDVTNITIHDVHHVGILTQPDLYRYQSSFCSMYT